MYVRRRRTGKPKRRAGRKQRVPRVLRPRHHIFSETFKASPLIVQNDGSGSAPLPAQVLTASMSSISQYLDYKALFKKFRILKLSWTILPTYAGAEPNQAEANIGMGGNVNTNTFMHYRKAWDGNSTLSPANELAMLQLNGVKTIGVNSQQRRPIKITMSYPTPQLTLDVGGGTGNYDRVKNEWASFDDTESPVISYGRVYTYGVNRGNGFVGSIGSVYADVFCKVTFAVADPR